VLHAAGLHWGMNARLQGLAYGAVLALVIGWVLQVGRDVFVPLVFGILVVYVIVGFARILARIPYLGPLLPVQLRQALSGVVISLGLVGLAFHLVAYTDEVLAVAPQYQRSLLAAIQRVAVLLHIETEPTWATLRQQVLGQLNIQRLLGSMLASVSSVIATVMVVLLYAGFLMVERRSLAAKMAGISSDPGNAARIQEVSKDIHARVGSYLALKTGVSVLLGAVCWIVMALLGLPFAGLLALLIAMLNYVPYLGSFLGIVIPVVVAIAQFGEPGAVLALLASLTAAQVLIGNFLDPYLMGSSLNLSPFAILVSLAVWSQLWGVAGAFLAVPITAVMAIVLSEFPGTRPIAILLSRDGRL
jgi:AI-2 transport protein TqsA